MTGLPRRDVLRSVPVDASHRTTPSEQHRFIVLSGEEKIGSTPLWLEEVMVESLRFTQVRASALSALPAPPAAHIICWMISRGSESRHAGDSSASPVVSGSIASEGVPTRPTLARNFLDVRYTLYPPTAGGVEGSRPDTLTPLHRNSLPSLKYRKRTTGSA